jgi:hypothetical protein
VNDGLLPDEALGPTPGGRGGKKRGDVGLGDGGAVEAVTVELGEWLARTALVSSAVEGEQPVGHRALPQTLQTPPRPPQTTLYCVDELALDWSRTQPAAPFPSWAAPEPLDGLAHALLPFLARLAPFVAATAPDAAAHAPTAAAKAGGAPASASRAAAAAAAGAASAGGGDAWPPFWLPPTVNVWLHSAGAVTPTHFDTFHNLLVQVGKRLSTAAHARP